MWFLLTHKKKTSWINFFIVVIISFGLIDTVSGKVSFDFFEHRRSLVLHSSLIICIEGEKTCNQINRHTLAYLTFFKWYFSSFAGRIENGKFSLAFSSHFPLKIKNLNAGGCVANKEKRRTRTIRVSLLKDTIQACMSFIFVPVFVQSHLSYISRLHHRFLFHFFLLALHADLKMYTNMKENSQSSPEQFNRFNFLPFSLFLMLLFLINLH